MLGVLEGPWVVEREGEKDGLVIIKDGGVVSFVGESAGDDTVLVQDDGCGPKDFKLQDLAGGLLCSVKLEEQDEGNQVLHLEASDGYCETWHRTAATDGTPKIVP